MDYIMENYSVYIFIFFIFIFFVPSTIIIVRKILSFNNCKMEIQGEIVGEFSYTEHSNDGSTLHRSGPIYSYYYNGIHYLSETEENLKRLHKRNPRVKEYDNPIPITLMVNEQNPEQVMEKGAPINIVAIIVGAFSLISAIPLILLLFFILK